MGGTWVWRLGHGTEGQNDYIMNTVHNLDENGLPTNPMTNKIPSASCNHLFMDAMQVKQNSIRYEWVVHGFGGLVRVLKVRMTYHENCTQSG